MNKTLSKKFLMCFLLLLLFFKPIFMDYKIHAVYRLLTYLVFGYVAYIYLRWKNKNKNPSAITAAFFAFEGWSLMMTIFGGGYFMDAFDTALLMVSAIAVIDIYSDRMDIVLRALMLHSEICVYINLFTVVFFPNGFFSRSNIAYGATQEWFLGADNSFAMWLFPALVIAWLYRQFFGKSQRCYSLTAAVFITQFFRGSATGLVGTSVFLIFTLFPLVKKVLTPLRSVGMVVAVFLSIVVFRVTDYLEPIIVGVLGKDMTFTARLAIWDNAIESIMARPFTGYGVLENSDMVDYLGRTNGFIWKGATHCHCHFLQVGFQGGFTGLLLLIIIYIVALRGCAKNWKNRFSQLCTYAVTAFSIMGITEVVNYPLMYILFGLAFFAGKMDVQQKQYLLRKQQLRAMRRYDLAQEGAYNEKVRHWHTYILECAELRYICSGIRTSTRFKFNLRGF